MIVKTDEIKSILSKGDIEKALDKLERANNSNELITIRSWYNQVNKNYQVGISSNESYLTELNRITLSLLNFIETVNANQLDKSAHENNVNHSTDLITKENALIEVNRKLAYAKHHLEQYKVIDNHTTIFKDKTGRLFPRIKKVPKYKLVSFSKDLNYRLATNDFTNFVVSFVSETGNYLQSDDGKKINDLMVSDHLISFKLDAIDINTYVDKIQFGAPEGYTLIFPDFEYCVVLMLLGGFKKKTGRRKEHHIPTKENFKEHVGTSHWKLKFHFNSEQRANDLMKCLKAFLKQCEKHRVNT